MFSLGKIIRSGTRCRPFHIVLFAALAWAILSAHAGPGPEQDADQPKLSVMVLPAITGDDDQARGPQIAVRWSGELPVQLQSGVEDAAGRWQAHGEPIELNEPMSLLPAPDQASDMRFRVHNATGAVLASARGEAETFGWSPTFVGPGLDGTVFATTVYDGDLIVGGSILSAGEVTVNRIARWDGSQWSALSGPNGTGMSGTVQALTVHNGDLIAGGWFTEAGGETVNYIARWDGTQWSAFSGPNGTGMNNWVQTLTVHNGDLIAGGWFTEAGGETVNRIARWDGSQWSALSGPNGTGVNGSRVEALTVHNGDLIAGGNFTRAGGEVVHRIARWDGSGWSALSGPNGTGVNDEVRALTDHNGDLIAGGWFTEAGGETVNYIARWDGTQWSAFSGPNGTGMNNWVYALSVHNDDLIVGGNFTEAGGETVNRIARWDGSEWSALNGPNGTGMNGTVYALTVHNDDLIAGGFFSEAGGETVNGIARWDGSQWSVLSGMNGTGMTTQVNALTVHNGDLIAGGSFVQAGGEMANRIARWDGSQWSALSGPNGTGMNDLVWALTVHNGDLIAGGGFTEAGGQPVNHIARWDGSDWSALSGPNGTGMNGTVEALAVHNDDLIVGGNFTEAGGETVNYIARWDGSQWSALNGPNGTGVNSRVEALTVHNGDLIAGGDFTEAGGEMVNRIARWDGSDWSALSGPNGTGMNSTVWALTIHNDDLIAGGQFTEAGGETVNRIARWDGSDWSALSGPNGTGMSNSVFALTVHNGDLIAGGDFTHAGGEVINHIARWNGNEWSALSGPNGTGINSTVWELTVHNGDLIAGGYFSLAGGLPAWRLAHWQRQISLTTLSPDSGPSAGDTTVTISGTDFQAGATVSFGGNACTNVEVPSSTEISCDTPSGSAGTVDVTVENPDGYSATLVDAYTYVNAPSLSAINPDSGPSAGGTIVTLSGSDFLSGATVNFAGNACITVAVLSSTEISCVTPPGTAGTTDVTVENPDGQIATLIDGFTYVDPPHISEINPGSGPAVGGTTVTLIGSAFQSGALVSFAGNACTNVEVPSSTEIICDTPPGTAGTVDVTVEDLDGQSAILVDGYTYLDAPSLSAVHPASGPSAGGTTVTLSGSDFQAGATVSFAGNACTNISVVSSTEINCVTPPGTAGTVDVTVENPDGQSATFFDGYTYVDAPSLSAVHPASGPSAGGTAVTLIGSAFQNGATVSFAGNACITVAVLSSTEISCETLAGTAGTADVIVENPDGQIATLIDGFTYFDPPAINAINPGSGPAAGGTTVTLSGSAFQAGALVSFAGSACINVDVPSSTEIICDTPPGAAGTVDVTVENPDGQSATLIDAYTYVDGPAINTINPDTGPSAGGTTVTLSGTAFQAGAVVSLGGNECSNVDVVSSTEISCDTPPGSDSTVDVVVENPDGQTATLNDGFNYVFSDDVFQDRFENP